VFFSKLIKAQNYITIYSFIFNSYGLEYATSLTLFNDVNIMKFVLLTGQQFIKPILGSRTIIMKQFKIVIIHLYTIGQQVIILSCQFSTLTHCRYINQDN